MGSIEKTAGFLWRLSPQKIYHLIKTPSGERKTGRELERISRYPRFKRGKVVLLGMTLTFNDSASFLYQYGEIFTKCNYKFEAKGAEPLIYDCGANIGLSVLYFKAIYPASVIKAFEADPEIAELLSENISENKLEKVEVINKAVWIRGGTIRFLKDGSDGGAISESNEAISVPSVRLKLLIEKETEIALLKLDIEGAETEVIEDCRNSLEHIEKIFIEYHSVPGKEQSLHIVLEILKNAGFRYFIQPISENKSPFLYFKPGKRMDLQLNIYASNECFKRKNENPVH